MPADGKRKLPKAGLPGQAKRRKTQANGAPKRAVNVDALSWKTVDVPEMFDDAEGFYGLEVVEGVDIVKDIGGTVQFVTAAPAAKPEAHAEEGDEFGGFDDEPKAPMETSQESPQAKSKSSELSAVQAKRKEQKKDRKDRKKSQKQPPKPVDTDHQDGDSEPELESNVFSKIEKVPEGYEDNDIDVDVSQWEPLDLSAQLLSAIARLKFMTPTLIQQRSIPEIMEGHDVIGKASTGSGKTLAFGIPIVENWLSRQSSSSEEERSPIALILAPTRELAHQIADHLQKLCAGLKSTPYVCSVTGGLSLQKQQRQLEKADIIVGTPGRLWEIMSANTKTLQSLRNIQFLVVDEADRLLKDGHFKEAQEIFKALDREETHERTEEESSEEDEADETDETPQGGRQTLVFSATFHKGLQQKLAGKGRSNLMGEGESLEYLLQKLNFREERPKFIDTNPVSQMAENLKEGIILCGDLEKDLYLYSVLLLQPTRRSLVFTNSIGSVRRLVPLLQNLGLPAFALHSDMIQKARLRSIERFKASGSEAPTEANRNTSKAKGILIATDVAARGLDIPGIDLVVHYHVPRSADDYVHRSGRTARAHSSGVSILLCGPKEAVPTQRLVAKVHAAAEAKGGPNLTKKSKKTDIVHTIDIDRRIVARLRERVVLAKQLTDASQAKERGSKDENWMKAAAEELGVEYDSEELDKASTWSGRGSGRKIKEKEARGVTKAEMGVMRAKLRDLLAKRVNTGVSEKYLGSGGIDVDELLRSGPQGDFLGKVDGLGLEHL
ncbi:P-loop containing nucleoside triphosphate hydrolase protein [Schizothecium vesticola]|uniref:ATP-dependent RNA helicase n=1 Tax=Schizothecium vesticola TaxID=314040 RepID=A0AA40EPI5_9PEZI|nr:P-loop containing nucleoside triphosphate hydrolase protein [Schizothecium vesticola]